MSRPEKCWVVFHPFVAKKSFLITQNVLHLTDSIKNTGMLDQYGSGGQMDAYKHMMWMGLLTQEINWRKSKRLGIAHEKGNYITFKKSKRKGKPTSHDKTASDMDLWNNELGIKLAQENKQADQSELEKIVIESILDGEAKVIKIDAGGKYLNCENKAISSDSLKWKWETEKCLVPSDYRPPGY